tara:strand:- start:444 stop:683 length:240 start_codon:yes stop_codon:yes gene_type:complete
MNLIKESEQLIAECKLILSEYLEYCDEKRTPYVCALKQTKEGYKEIEEFVVHSVCMGGNTAGYAIMEKERQLNPNYITD